MPHVAKPSVWQPPADCHAGRAGTVSAQRTVPVASLTGRALWEERVAAAVLVRRDGVGVAGQGPVELAAGADAELGEDLAQVVLDRARADEQPGADLGIGQ